MMTRKFKHKSTGKVAEETNFGFLVDGHENVPKWVVRDSNDWLEITEPEVPQYVKCVNVNDREPNGNYVHFTKNKIYPIEIKTKKYESDKVKNDRGDSCSFSKEQLDGTVKIALWATRFEPSTKEQYDLQQREEIMQECIKRFPKGSVVKCANRGTIHTVAKVFDRGKFSDMYKEEVYYYGGNNDVLAVMDEEIKGFWLHYEGKYAELVSLPKTPIFRTEDGVDLFEWDKYWWVHEDFRIHEAKAHKDSGLFKERKYFSTEEKAKEYVIFNKPCLSLMDMKRHGYGIEFIYLLAERRNKTA